MHFTTKMKLHALLRSIFKIIFFPILAPLWALGLLYREEKKKEKKKQFIEGVEDVIGLSEDGLMLSGQHRLAGVNKGVAEFDGARWYHQTHEMGPVPEAAQHWIKAANDPEPEKPEFPFHVGDYALVDTRAMKGRGQFVRILNTSRQTKSVMTRWLMKDGSKGRKQTYNISSLIKKPLPAGYFTTFAEPKSVTLKVFNTSGFCQLEIRIAGSVYEANLRARTFKAKVKMVATYSIGTLRLYDQDNKLIGANPWLEYVREGQVVDLTFLLTDEMMKKFETKKTSGVLWQGKPIECLDDGHLYNIVMAIHNGEWASGAKVNFAGPMEDALLKEYNKRGLDTPGAIDKFVERNNLWEESRTRAHH